MKATAIPVFIINLPCREDRRKNITEEFAGRDEFSAEFITPETHLIRTLSLWLTITKIIREQFHNNEFVIICEDDHQFTRQYDKKLFFEAIEEAGRYEADLLLGGVSGFESSIRCSQAIFWINRFTGLQFTVIFKRFFRAILDAHYKDTDITDRKISLISKKKFMIYPFISTQKEFGYSDLTVKNNEDGRVEALFEKSAELIMLYERIFKRYVQLEMQIAAFSPSLDYDDIVVPAYVINLPERTDRAENIRQQFKGRNEFDVRLISAIKHANGAFGLWQTMLQIVRLAIANDDDMVVICEDDHQFTEHYDKISFLKQVVESHRLGADLLLGGVSHFRNAFFISEQRYWLNYFYGCQFMVVYKKFFRKIIEEPFDLDITADGHLSRLTANKIGIYPFISVQDFFGYSDVNPVNSQPGRVERLFNNAMKRLDNIYEIYTWKGNSIPEISTGSAQKPAG